MGGFRRSTKCQNYHAQQEQLSAREVAIKSKCPKHIRTIVLDLMEDVSGRAQILAVGFSFWFFMSPSDRLFSDFDLKL